MANKTEKYLEEKMKKAGMLTIDGMMNKSKLIKKMKSLRTSLNEAVCYAENHILNHYFSEAQVAIDMCKYFESQISTLETILSCASEEYSIIEEV